MEWIVRALTWLGGLMIAGGAAFAMALGIASIESPIEAALATVLCGLLLVLVGLLIDMGRH